MGRGPFANMKRQSKCETCKLRDYLKNVYGYTCYRHKHCPTTVLERKKSPYYFDLNKLKNETFYMMAVQRACGYGKTHAIMMKERKDEKTTDERRTS